MQIGDGQNDGIFKIKKNEGLSQAIISELGLNSEQANNLGKSIWTQIFEQVDKAVQDSESKVQVKNENGNYNVNEGQIIKFSQKIWSNVNDIVNNLGKINANNTLSDSNQFPDNWNNNGTPPENINPEDYTLENLKMRYPENKYLIEINDDGNVIKIKLKSSNKEIMEIFKDNDWIYITEHAGENQFYSEYKNGALCYYDSPNGAHRTDDPDLVVGKIHEAVCKRKRNVIPTTGNIEDSVKLINKDNVEDVISKYQDKYDESIFSAIISEYGLDIDKRIEYIKHIKDALIESYKAKGVYCDDISAEFDQELRYQKRKVGFANAKFLDTLVDQLRRRAWGKFTQAVSSNFNPEKSANGKIDNDFSQCMVTGSCWVLAPIKAMTGNAKAKKALESLISVDRFGNVTITLKGVNRKYTFTKEEIAGATEYSYGDMDVRAIEMAVNKYLHEEHKDINLANNASEATRMLIGAECEQYTNPSDKKMKSIIEKIKSGNFVCIVSCGGKRKVPQNAINENNEPVSILKQHAYSVIGADDKYIYLVNPHDTAKTLKMNYKDFEDTFNSVQMFDVSDL